METYELIRSGRKTLALEITRDCRVVVRAPRRLSKEHIDAFVDKAPPGSPAIWSSSGSGGPPRLRHP